MKKYNTMLTRFILYLIANMVIFPQLYISQTFNGISAWAINVLPSILPFMIFAKLITNLGATKRWARAFQRPCKRLFNTPSQSAFVFLTSIISGYPIGSTMTAELYERGEISQTEAFRMSSFCSTSGPMFIIGAVGISMLHNAIYGYIIFLSHALGAIINGILYRNLTTSLNSLLPPKTLKKDRLDISNLILDSSLSVISVGAIIAIFFVVITSLSPIFNLLPETISCVLKGMIEITHGCLDISSVICNKWSVVACTFVVSFGGLSTIIQSMTMLEKIKMPAKLFCRQKLTHAIFSAIIAFAFILFV